MGRSTKKGPFVAPKLLARVEKMEKSGDKSVIRTWYRSSTIVPEFIGYTFEVHNGKIFHRVHVTEEMVGHKFGEFSPTRMFRGHSGGR